MTAPQIYETITLPGSSSLPATVTAPTVANTMGTWTTMLAATARDAAGIVITGQHSISSGVSFALADIGVDSGSGTPDIIVPKLMFGRRSTGNNLDTAPVYIPTRRIPAGSRISARYQCDTISSPLLVLGINLAAPAPDWPAVRFGTAVDIGTTLSTSKGTAVDPGVTANTKSAWADLTTSSPINARWLVLSANMDQANDYAWSYRIDVAVGSTPQIVYPDLCLSSGAQGLQMMRMSVPLHVAAGQPVKVRVASNATTTSRILTINAQLIG